MNNENDFNYVNDIVSILKEVALSNEKVFRVRVASAIVYKKKIVSIGINSLKSSPFQLKFASSPYSIYFHAETMAIKNALNYYPSDLLKKMEIVVCRVKYYPELKRQDYALAKPCSGCMKAIQTFGLKRVFFSTQFDIMMINNIFEPQTFISIGRVKTLNEKSFAQQYR